MMIVNNVEEKKGFKNFDVIDQTTNYTFYKDDIFLEKNLFINEQNKKNLEGTSIYFSTKEIFDNIKIDNSFQLDKIDLRSDNIKLIVQITNAFYHKWMDNFFHIVAFLKKFPEGLIVLDYGFNNSFKEKDIFINFLLEHLNKNNCKYVFIQNNFLMAINNFYNIQTTTLSDVQINLIYDSVKYLIKDINKQPNKKVYISRKKIKTKRNPETIGKVLKENTWIEKNEYDLIGEYDVRVLEEEALELYFKNIGFDILYAEDFKSIEETVNYFHDVKTLVSVTSSAFVSSMFMQPGGKIIDLATPHFLNESGSAFTLTSSQFVGFAYAKKHLFLSIPSIFYGTKIVEYFNNNKNLVDFLISDNYVH